VEKFKDDPLAIRVCDALNAAVGKRLADLADLEI
jgi:hypothetical protein